MKKLLVLAAAVVGISAYGQGWITIQNQSSTAITNAHWAVDQKATNLYVAVYYAAVTDTNGMFTPQAAAAFAATNTQLSTLSFTRAGGFAGLIQATNVALGGTAADQWVILQVRAWSRGNLNVANENLYTTYEQAIAAGGAFQDTVFTGYSMLMYGKLGGSTAPLNIQTATAGVSIFPGGLTAFTVDSVPEPSTIALAVLGLLGVFYIRRRK